MIQVQWKKCFEKLRLHRNVYVLYNKMIREKGELRMIYFDMDGVLADFDRGVVELCGMRQLPQDESRTDEEDALMWEKIREVGHFYDKLEPMPGAVEMFRKVYDLFGAKCEILTGIPKPERGIVTSAEDKVAWTRRILSDKVKVNTVARKDKKLFCTGPDSILVDDLEKNITEWKAAGGTGILFRNAEQAMEEILKYAEIYG